MTCVQSLSPCLVLQAYKGSDYQFKAPEPLLGEGEGVQQRSEEPRTAPSQEELVDKEEEQVEDEVERQQAPQEDTIPDKCMLVCCGLGVSYTPLPPPITVAKGFYKDVTQYISLGKVLHISPWSLISTVYLPIIPVTYVHSTVCDICVVSALCAIGAICDVPSYSCSSDSCIKR